MVNYTVIGTQMNDRTVSWFGLKPPKFDGLYRFYMKHPLEIITMVSTYLGDPTMATDRDYSKSVVILDEHFMFSIKEPNFLNSGNLATIYVSSTYPEKYLMTLLRKRFDNGALPHY